MDFNDKDLRANSSQEMVFDAEQATNLDLQPFISFRHGASLSRRRILQNLIILGALKKGLFKLRKSDKGN